MAKKEKIVINETTLENYTIKDSDFIFENCKKNKDGYPIFYPTKDELNRRIVLSFLNVQIFERTTNELLDNEIGNFNIVEKEVFKRKVKSEEVKAKFLIALISPNLYLKGGVYFKGRYVTDLFNKGANIDGFKSFFTNYFAVEDKDILLKYASNDSEKFIPFWPIRSEKNQNAIILSAVNAFVADRNGDNSTSSDPIYFDIAVGDVFDVTKEKDLKKIEVFKAVYDSEKIVNGFYHNGGLVSEKLNNVMRLEYERLLITKNFGIEQGDFVKKIVNKDPKTGYPIYWPRRTLDGRKVCITVMDAHLDGAEEEINFNVIIGEVFNLSNPEYLRKLEIIRLLLNKSQRITGALYFVGQLMNGSTFSNYDLVRARFKTERLARVYFDDNPDFARINEKFTIEDRDNILNISNIYNNFYPGNIVKVEKKYENYIEENKPILVVDYLNIIDVDGNYLYRRNICYSIHENSKIDDKEVIGVLAKIFTGKYKVRGAIYYKGVDIAKSSPKVILKKIKALLSDEDYQKLSQIKLEKPDYKYELDRKSLMPKFFPTQDKQGRTTILSVVSGDVFFGSGKNTVRAVQNANFDIFEGETFGLVGESGSGKTTISRAILRINKLTKGGIYYQGKLISSTLSKKTSMNLKKHIQMIFQDPAASLNERANIDYIVSEGLYNFKLFKSKEDRFNKVLKMLGRVGLLPEHLSRYPHEFSGGQRQRIGIARALIIEPQLVLADEPISALDVSIRAQILNLLLKLQKEKGLTYLFIAHDLSIIRYISDRIAVMHKGHIVELGSANEIYTHPLHPYTRSLLTAIPQPDPKTKEQRKKVPYVQGNIVYNECSWEELMEGHFVLVNDELRKDIKKRIKKFTDVENK